MCDEWVYVEMLVNIWCGSQCVGLVKERGVKKGATEDVF